jgi:hypothetical protein
MSTETHYICTGGCHGVAPVPGSCGAESCEKHGEPLVACHCTDGKHAGPYDTKLPHQEENLYSDQKQSMKS